MYVLVLFLLYIFKDFFPLQHILILALIHTSVFLYRSYYLYRYAKNKQSISDTQSIRKWVWIFRSGSFVAAVGWGSFFFFLENTPIEYNLIIISTVIGLAAIGMSTIGALFSVYLSFMIPMLGMMILWLIIHSTTDEIYTNIIFPTFFMVGYLFFAARQFSNNYAKSYKAEANIQEKKKLLEESQRITHIGSWKYDLVENILTCSDEIYKIFEVPSDKAISYKMVLNVTHPDDRKRVAKTYADSLKAHAPYETTHRLLFKDGRIKYVKEECETTFDKEGNPLISIGTVQDITKQKLMENKLKEQKETMSHLAYHDTLTKLPNRMLLNDRLSKAIESAKRDNRKFALLFIDLDHFKEINDSLGHHIGDEVLKETAKRFYSIVHKNDTLARLGGDEFTIIMENLKHGQDASILAEKIIETLSQPITVAEHSLYISCSIGISLYPSDGTDLQDLLKYADAAMYRAKEEGRSDFQFYSCEMTLLAFERILMETNMRSGLKKGEFEVYYQPQVDGYSDTLIGMEALVRWQHPEMGFVFPSKFIPLAESTGLIVKLDRYIMKEAIQQLCQWYDKGLNPGILSLNLSIQQIKQKDFISYLEDLLRLTGCKPEWIEFEITESQIMTNIKKAIKCLTQLNDLGVNVAIDDFGTGYSSLSYLKKLPISKLKIDQSFIRELPDNEEDIAITQAVIALSKSLKLNIIAEGVESIEQKEFLVTNGCVNIQGYYYSRAVEREAFEKILKGDHSLIMASL